ncbi:hypothetical protein [Arthrobacter psychrochitiniphilus]|uniref:phosphoketolase family protein n=1 Tax=Arthrobacter psychrochitiniphilus TaxID=291045 RepID=UPI003F7BB0D7
MDKQEHPRGIPDADFEWLFTPDGEVIVALHGYGRAFHQLLHGHLNLMSPYHLALEAVDRVGLHFDEAQEQAGHCQSMFKKHGSCIREHRKDLPEIRDWVWTPPKSKGNAS